MNESEIVVPDNAKCSPIVTHFLFLTKSPNDMYINDEVRQRVTGHTYDEK